MTTLCQYTKFTLYLEFPVAILMLGLSMSVNVCTLDLRATYYTNECPCGFGFWMSPAFKIPTLNGLVSSQNFRTNKHGYLYGSYKTEWLVQYDLIPARFATADRPTVVLIRSHNTIKTTGIETGMAVDNLFDSYCSADDQCPDLHWCRINDNSCRPCEVCGTDEALNLRDPIGQLPRRCTSPVDCVVGIGPKVCSVERWMQLTSNSHQPLSPLGLPLGSTAVSTCGGTPFTTTCVYDHSTKTPYWTCVSDVCNNKICKDRSAEYSTPLSNLTTPSSFIDDGGHHSQLYLFLPGILAALCVLFVLGLLLCIIYCYHIRSRGKKNNYQPKQATINVEAGECLLYFRESNSTVDIVVLSTVDVNEDGRGLPIEHQSATVESSPSSHRNSRAQATEQVDGCVIDNCENEDQSKKPCLGGPQYSMECDDRGSCELNKATNDGDNEIELVGLDDNVKSQEQQKTVTKHTDSLLFADDDICVGGNLILHAA